MHKKQWQLYEIVDVLTFLCRLYCNKDVYQFIKLYKIYTMLKVCNVIRNHFLNLQICRFFSINLEKTFCRINLFFKKGIKAVETATNSEIIEYKIHFHYIHCDKKYYLVYNGGVLMKHEGWSINKAERAQF